jgi:hypothetical protein
MGIHAVDGGGGRQILPGKGLKGSFVDLRRMEEADFTGGIIAWIGHGSRL